MRDSRQVYLLALLLAMHMPCDAKNPLLATVDDFSLPATNGDTISLPKDAEFSVICFLGTECPLARIYGPRLNEMAQQYRQHDVRFIGINSNVQDSMDELRRYAQEYEIEFPIAKDYDRTVAVNMKATRTPEVLVVDRVGNIHYRGRIDDQYEPGIARSQATQHNLRDALEQLVADHSVSVPATEPVGCLIALPKRATAPQGDQHITFANQISRVLHKHCVECHRQGEIGPFVLDDYDEVVGWSEMMVEVIDQNRMPPWHANPEHGSFANARHMSAAEKQLIRDWVEAGSPFGDAKDLPPQPIYESGWRLPKEPDVVFQMNKDAYQVPAEGVVEYQYFVVDPKFTEDKWVSAAQVIPGNSSVVHHCIAFIRPPDGADFGDFGMLAGYVPGQLTTTLPAGYARRVPAGARIVFQMHYTPNGKPTADNTKIGLVFADEESVTHEVFAIVGIDQDFEIPPKTAAFTVSRDVGWFPKDGQLLAIAPHMHLRGKSFRLTAKRKTGSTTLLDVPSYDFNWQHNYELTEPLPLTDVSQLKFQVTFDNSSGNPTNPDPNEYVTWGDQTWQEMAVAFLSVAQPRVRDAKPQIQTKVTAEQRARLAELDRQAEAFADRYLEKFDHNQDGQISYREMPASVRMFGYFDHDRDGVVSRDEIRLEKLSRLRSFQ